MGRLVDVVGHFGTTFSFATVGSTVARALRQSGNLGRVMNLDPEWHPSYGDLREAQGSGRFVLMFTPPHHYIDAFVDRYGRDQSAIFMSPNTDRLSDEHALTCAKFGLVITPSNWCNDVVRKYVPGVDSVLVPLGVEETYTSGRVQRMNRLRDRAAEGVCHAVHMSTDQTWPGRKGTEELVEAWSIAEPFLEQSRLTLHVPPAIQRYAEYMVRERKVDQSVTVTTGGLRGTSDIASVVKSADIVVAPSRCEGFGLMFLAALVAGVPLLGTYNTGQMDFMRHCPGWLGVPTPRRAAMAREEGLAPIVEPHVLATSLLAAVQSGSRTQMLDSNESWMALNEGWGTWGMSLPAWVEVIQQWMEEA